MGFSRIFLSEGHHGSSAGYIQNKGSRTSIRNRDVQALDYQNPWRLSEVFRSERSILRFDSRTPWPGCRLSTLGSEAT